MGFQGAFKIVGATLRPTSANVPKPFPYGPTANIVRVKSMMVTAAAGNAGTIYCAFNLGTGATVAQTTRAAADRERTMFPLAAKQSITFSGMTFGGYAERDICFGSGFSYIHSGGTSNGAICTWLEQV